MPRQPYYPEISVVIPVFNEEDSLDSLQDKLTTSLNSLNRPWEVIFIDDGSRDNSFKKLEQMAQRERRFKVVRFVRNFGQTAALAAGIDNAV